MNRTCKALLFVLLFAICYPLWCLGAKPALLDFKLKSDSVMQRETALVDGVKYTVLNVLSIQNGYNRFYIKDSNNKIVYQAGNDAGIITFRFIDFNGDGYKDVITETRGVDSGGQDLIIYDATSKKFKLAGNCSNAEKIPKTKFYCTYEDCCMGRNWGSDLFYIANSKIINVGHIKYDDDKGISFYKLKGKKKIFIKKWRVHINGNTPITTGKHVDFDLRYYWAKHWSAFIK